MCHFVLLSSTDHFSVKLVTGNVLDIRYDNLDAENILLASSTEKLKEKLSSETTAHGM